MFKKWTYTSKIEEFSSGFELALQCHRDDANECAELHVSSNSEKIVAKVFLAWSQKGDSFLWPRIVAGYREYCSGQVLRKPESVPWLAAVLLPASASLKPYQLELLGGLEPCWAWAVLETLA